MINIDVLYIFSLSSDNVTSLLKTGRLPAQRAASSGGLTVSIPDGKYIIFVLLLTREKKAKRTPKKKLPENDLKVKKCLFSVPTVFTSRYFKHKRHCDLSSVTKAEIFIAFIELSEKMSLSCQAFDW